MWTNSSPTPQAIPEFSPPPPTAMQILSVIIDGVLCLVLSRLGVRAFSEAMMRAVHARLAQVDEMLRLLAGALETGTAPAQFAGQAGSEDDPVGSGVRPAGEKAAVRRRVFRAAVGGGDWDAGDGVGLAPDEADSEVAVPKRVARLRREPWPELRHWPALPATREVPAWQESKLGALTGTHWHVQIVPVS